MASTRSSYILLLAAILLSILATATATATARTDWCKPGKAIPIYPLMSCRMYMLRHVCGEDDPSAVPVVKERCCADLEKIVPYCRCEALKIMMDDLVASGEARLYSCSSLAGLLDFAPKLVSETECNLMTIHGRPFCNPLGLEGTTTSG